MVEKKGIADSFEERVQKILDEVNSSEEKVRIFFDALGIRRDQLMEMVKRISRERRNEWGKVLGVMEERVEDEFCNKELKKGDVLGVPYWAIEA
jgi:hypothetical protein